MYPNPVEIRPTSNWKYVLLLSFLVLFAALCIPMTLLAESATDVLTGLACFAICLAAVIALPVIRSRLPLIVVSIHGIETRHRTKGTTFVPWSEVERIGVARQWNSQSPFPIKYAGVRLSSYQTYLRSLSPQMAASMRRVRRFMRVAGPAMALLGDFSDMTSGEPWRALIPDPSGDALQRFGGVRDIVAMLAWSRRTVGYEITFSWMQLDRSQRKFVELLNWYLGYARWAAHHPYTALAAGPRVTRS